MASEPLILDLEQNKQEEVCVDTMFYVFNRVGVSGVNGEIARKSVFRLGVVVEWVGEGEGTGNGI
jgi:hypothetical protein